MYSYNKKIKIIAITFIVIVLVICVIYFIIQTVHNTTASVKIYVVPDTSLIKIDGKEYQSGQTVNLSMGTYQITATCDNFYNYSQELKVEETNKNITVSVLMNASNNDGKKWLENHKNEVREAEGRAGTLAIQDGEKFSNKFPITKKLPYKQGVVYTIGYKNDPNDENNIIITITSSTRFWETALQKIRELGYNPGDFDIEFNNYENPFHE